jgi:chemotaxis protein MotB
LAEQKQQQPEVQYIRQSRGRHKKDYGGQWKIAYADFVTAMMVFFLIMWIVSMIPQTQKDNIADYFKGRSNVQSKDSKTNKEGADAAKVDKEVPPVDVLEDAKKYVERLQELRKEIESFIAENQTLMKNSNELIIEETAEGLTITLAENKRPMFVLGGSTIEATTAQVLQKLGKPLSQSRFQIKVEGHTDSSGYRPGATYSNWELSADRANAARRELLSGGLSEDKIAEVIGYADRRPFVKDDPRNALNRRITITAVVPKDINTKEEALSPQQVAAEEKASKDRKNQKPPAKDPKAKTDTPAKAPAKP